MANNFKNWIDTPVAGTNVLSQANFASDTQRANGFKAGDPASAIRVNTGLRQANLVAASLMEAIQVAGVDISSLTHLSTISDVQAKITAGLNAIAKNGLNATTLNGLLTGSNGISTALNSAGDKVEAKLAIPETGPITLASTHVPRPAILINVEQGGPPHAGGISCSREVGGETTYVGPAGIMIDDGAYVLSINNTNDSFIAYTDIHGMPLGQALIGGGPKGNVKTIAGQSIYGTGDITYYAHNINVLLDAAIDADFSFQIISSSNLNVNSLANLKTLLKSEYQIVPAWGNCDMMMSSAGFVQAVSRVNVYYIPADNLKTGDPSVVTKSWTTLTQGKDVSFTDHVETL